MRKLVHLAVPAALLALSAGAAGPASAEPQRLDEGRLAGLAAGQDTTIPSFTASNLTSSLTSTEVSSSNSVSHVLDQALNGMAANNNYATAVGSTGVTATGDAVTTVTGMIGGAGGIAGQ